MADKAKDKAYHVSDLGEGQEPDPLGDASLTAQERATAGTTKPDETAEKGK